jgi:hypothetical protein
VSFEVVEESSCISAEFDLPGPPIPFLTKDDSALVVSRNSSDPAIETRADKIRTIHDYDLSRTMVVYDPGLTALTQQRLKPPA